MYKDDIWHRKFVQAVEKRKEDFTEKEIRRYRIQPLLDVAGQVAKHSEHCETCREYQQTLTRLEEEMGALPESQAQRQYQRRQIREMQEHFVQEHNLFPGGYHLQKYLVQGLIGGAALGILGFALYGSLFYLIGGFVVGLLFGLGLGSFRDAQVRQQRRLF